MVPDSWKEIEELFNFLFQQNGDQTPSNFTDRHLEDKAEWAKERLSLQLSLNNAERQIEQMQHDLKIERDRRSTIPTSGILSDHDKDKVITTLSFVYCLLSISPSLYFCAQ